MLRRNKRRSSGHASSDGLLDLDAVYSPRKRELAIYARVSTDAQNTDTQRQELEAWAERAGRTAFRVYEDGRRPDRPACRFWDGYKEMG